MLKDLMFSTWSNDDCESAADIVKLLSLVDFYLPFFPLERNHITTLFNLRLELRQKELLTAGYGMLTWNRSVVDFLVSKVCFTALHQMFFLKYLARHLWTQVQKPRCL